VAIQQMLCDTGILHNKHPYTVTQACTRAFPLKKRIYYMDDVFIEYITTEKMCTFLIQPQQWFRMRPKPALSSLGLTLTKKH